MTITVHRVEGLPHVTCVSAGPVTILFEGDGPFDLTEQEWAAVQASPAAAYFTEG